MQFKHEIIKFKSENYPFLLRETQNPPPLIYIRGKLPDKKKIKISIVGTRKATGAGKILTRETAQKLANLGIVVVSGLAMGIDTAAHEGAVSRGGETVAVLGCGIDKIYPAQNDNLAKEILSNGGAIISEYEPGIPAFPSQFLERNRIVAGLSLATIVIEAPRNSGAIVTARLAAEAGREVLVFPGPVNHPNYVGSHKLIRDGARLVSSFEDIMEDLGLESRKSKVLPKPETFKDKNQLLIVNVIRESGQSLGVDKISELTKLEPQIVNQNVAFLVIDGIIKESGGKYSI